MLLLQDASCLFQSNLVRRTTDPSFTKASAQIWVKGHVGVNRGHLVKIFKLLFLPYGTSYDKIN